MIIRKEGLRSNHLLRTYKVALVQIPREVGRYLPNPDGLIGKVS